MEKGKNHGQGTKVRIRLVLNVAVLDFSLKTCYSNHMQVFMNVLGGLTSLYMLLIFARIMLTWFSGAGYGRPVELLCRITDPYLDWFRRFPLQFGMLDLSPILALAVLSVANNVFGTLGRYGRISLGIMLAMLVSAVWSAASFLIGFFIIILVLRLIAYLTNRDVYRSFWGIIDNLSRPVLFRINRIIFRSRLVNYLAGLIVAIAVLLGLRLGLGFLVRLLIGVLSRSSL
ncbi:MAG: YggT family protein [Treponema sp.]|jgi:YggT family protein|nr:YggT family protein [Treponema sp.]